MIPTGPKVSVELQSAAVSVDGSGIPVETWTTFSTVQAVFTPITIAEQFRHNRETEISTHVAFIDYTAALTGRMRLKYGGRYYAVLSIENPFNQNRFLKLKLQALD